RRSSRRPTASSWPSGTSSCGARASCSAAGRPVSRSSASRGCAQTGRCSSSRGPRRRRSPTPRGRSTRRSSGGSPMRIIAGSRKGARVVAARGAGTRPTGDRVREAAFNLIGPVDGASVLDLYAGTGAMGLEALSRGADRAVFVESDRAACKAIERNLEKLRLTGARVVCDDVLRFLATERGTYDLVLVDPPYDLVE